MSEAIHICKGPCRRMTRPASLKAADHPDTVSRMRDGMCKPCVNGNTEDLSSLGVRRKAKGQSGLIPCTGTCGKMTRNSRMPAGQFPDAVVRSSGGMCSTCRRELEPGYAQRKRDMERERSQRIPVQNEEQTRAALEAYFRWRRPYRQQQQRIPA